MRGCLRGRSGRRYANGVPLEQVGRRRRQVELERRLRGAPEAVAHDLCTRHGDDRVEREVEGGGLAPQRELDASGGVLEEDDLLRDLRACGGLVYGLGADIGDDGNDAEALSDVELLRRAGVAERPVIRAPLDDVSSGRKRRGVAVVRVA